MAREGESEGFVSLKILRRKRKSDLPEQASLDFAAEWFVVPLVQHISNRIVYDCCSLQITYQWVKSMFAMATASVLVEPNEEECSVCHEQFTEPKLLQCGHLLCRHCLLSWLKSQAEAKCPLCRCAIVEPEERGSKSLEDIADGFPTDLAMAALVEADRLLNKGHNCCVCEDVAATCLCLITAETCFCQPLSESPQQTESIKASHCGGPVLSDARQESPFTALPPVQSMPTKLASSSVPHTACPSAMFALRHDTGSCPEVKDLEDMVDGARAVLAELAAMLSAGRDRAGHSHQPARPAPPRDGETNTSCHR